jgi:hypothetical protein
MQTSEERALIETISAERMTANMRVVVQHPDRYPGSRAEWKFAEMLLEHLEPVVDSVWIEQFPIWSYEPGAGTIKLPPPFDYEIECVVNTGIRGGAGQGLLIDIGDGSSDAVGRVADKLEGNIAFLKISERNRDLDLSTVAEYLIHKSAISLVYVNQLRMGAPMHYIDAAIPVISVSRDFAEPLYQIAQQSNQLQMKFDAPLNEIESTAPVVCALIYGRKRQAGTVYLSCHIDCFFSGANDNGSGVVLLLELARVFSARRPEVNIMFLFFGAEESGTRVATDPISWIRGSLAYTERYQRLMLQPGPMAAIAAINADVVGFDERTTLWTTPELHALVHTAMQDLNQYRPVNGPFGAWMGSDNFAFHSLGVPSILMMPSTKGESDSRYWSLYHTNRDNLDNISQRALFENARMIGLLTTRLANQPENHRLSTNNLARAIQLSLSSKQTLALRQRLHELTCELESNAERLASMAHIRFVNLMHQHGFGLFGITGNFGYKFSLIQDYAEWITNSISIADTTGHSMEDLLEQLRLQPDVDFLWRFGPSMSEERRNRLARSTIVERLNLYIPKIDDIVKSYKENDRPSVKEALAIELNRAIQIETQWARQFNQELERFRSTYLATHG